MMTLLKNDEIDRKKWISFIAGSCYSTPFQTPEFYDFTITNKSEVEVFAIEKAGELCALCLVTLQKESGLKNYFSRRAIIYGGPVFTDELSLTVLLESITAQLKNKVIYIETRNFNNYSTFIPVFEKLSWNYTPYLNIEIPIENTQLEEVVKNMKYNRRREIRISKEQGAIYRKARNEEEIEHLYNILKELYSKRVKLPLPDLSFFLNLFRSDIGHVFVVLHDDNVIGGSFCVGAENTALFTWYYCGLREYHKKIFPTHLAIIAAIEYACLFGMKGIDLMGAGKPEEDYGVRSYKQEFGGNLVSYGRFIKIYNPLLYKVGKTGLEILKKIK